MQFSLTGFSQSANVRLYAFQGVTNEGMHREFTVGVDLNLARRYAISLQELPLMCRKLLEGQPAVGEVESLTFSEQEMLGIAERRAEAQREAEQKSKNHRRPPSSKVGQAWR
jgi:hypothetical protein